MTEPTTERARITAEIEEKRDQLSQTLDQIDQRLLQPALPASRAPQVVAAGVALGFLLGFKAPGTTAALALAALPMALMRRSGAGLGRR